MLELALELSRTFMRFNKSQLVPPLYGGGRLFLAALLAVLLLAGVLCISRCCVPHCEINNFLTASRLIISHVCLFSVRAALVPQL